MTCPVTRGGFTSAGFVLPAVPAAVPAAPDSFGAFLDNIGRYLQNAMGVLPHAPARPLPLRGDFWDFLRSMSPQLIPSIFALISTFFYLEVVEMNALHRLDVIFDKASLELSETLPWFFYVAYGASLVVGLRCLSNRYRDMTTRALMKNLLGLLGVLMGAHFPLCTVAAFILFAFNDVWSTTNITTSVCLNILTHLASVFMKRDQTLWLGYCGMKVVRLYQCLMLLHESYEFFKTKGF